MIDIKAYMSISEVTTYTYTPKYESIEIFSYIGSYVGMWLGASIIVLFDFFETIFLLVKYPFQKYLDSRKGKKDVFMFIRVHQQEKNMQDKQISIGRHLTKIFQDSMISGFSKIFTAASIFQKIVFIIVFLSCNIGFFYQFAKFMEFYWQYKTVMNIQITDVPKTELPSVTICIGEGLSNRKLCSSPEFSIYCQPVDKLFMFLSTNACDCSPQRFCKNGTASKAKIVKNLYPPPYDTKCVDYMTTWKARGGHGPTNYLECKAECQINSSVKHRQCVLDEFKSLPTNEKLCRGSVKFDYKRDENRPVIDEFIKCINETCGSACHEEYYQVSTVTEEIFKNDCKKWEKNQTENKDKKPKTTISFTIDLGGMETKTFNYSPKFQSLEIYSNLGGYVGLWLGISIIALFDFAEMMIIATIHSSQIFFKYIRRMMFTKCGKGCSKSKK